MKKLLSILFIFQFVITVFAQENTQPDFKWGNGHYFNLNIGDTLIFNGTEIELLQIRNHHNRIKVGKDTVWIKVSRRTLPVVLSGVRIFVAENINVRALKQKTKKEELLKKDALICLSDFQQNLLDPYKFIFPVSYNDGFIWRAEEDNHMFSFNTFNGSQATVNAGIDIDLHEARGEEMHWILAFENSTVEWIEERAVDAVGKEACVLLKSNSYPDIYYLYEHLYAKNVEVKMGDQLIRGEPIGTVWGDDNWGHLHFAVIKSDTVPDYQRRTCNAVNFFPQLYELYYKNLHNFGRSYSKGIIKFGQSSEINRGIKNLLAFEQYSGKGWKLGDWNITDRVDAFTKGVEGNARLQKNLFPNRLNNCENPDNFYEYEINVGNGVYRIRAKVGDLKLSSWQKVEFEGIKAAEYSLDEGKMRWTSEKVVKVEDSKLTIKIFVDEENNKVAGIGEIVFQKVY